MPFFLYSRFRAGPPSSTWLAALQTAAGTISSHRSQPDGIEDFLRSSAMKSHACARVSNRTLNGNLRDTRIQGVGGYESTRRHVDTPASIEWPELSPPIY